MNSIRDKAKIFLENIENDIIEIPENDIEEMKPKLLMYAILDDQIKAIKWLLENITDVNVLSLIDILIIAKCNKIEILKLLVENGLDLNKFDDKGTSILFSLMSIESVNESVEYIVKNIPDINIKEQKSAVTPLILSSYESKKEFVELLLKYGADVNLQNDIGDTALINAVHSGNVEIVKLLLEYGANTEIRQKDGDTALMILCIECDDMIVSVEIASLLLKYGADINKRAIDSISALYLAVESGNVEITKLLLENGADINFKYINPNATILHIASKVGNIDIIKLLLDKGIDINIENEEKFTPLNIAIFSNNIDTVKFLIKNGASINTNDTAKISALISSVASKNININIIKYLIDNGADVNFKFRKRLSALYSARNQNIEVVKLLIENGANINEIINIPNNHKFSFFKKFFYYLNNFIYGKLTLFKSAIIDNNIELVKVFIAYEVKLDKECLLLALRQNNIEIVKLLIKTDFYTKKDYLSVLNSNLWTESFFISKEILELLLSEGLELNMKSLLANMDNIEILKIMIESVKDKEILKNLYSIAYENNNMKVIALLGEYGIKEKGSMNFLAVEFMSGVSQGKKNNGFISRFFSSFMLNQEYNSYKEKNNYKPFEFYTFEVDIIRMINLKYEITFIENVLKNNKCDLNKTNREGLTPLMICCKNDNYEMVQLLLKYGVDIDIKDSLGQTAKDYCLYNEELIKLFDENSMKHNPQKLVKILTNFTEDKPMKFTTHTWDFGELKKEYGNFDGYMKAVKIQWDSIKNDLEKLSLNLYIKVYNFLWETNPNIAIGWSSMDGLKQWCDDGNNPFDFKNFKEIVFSFKTDIEIRKEDNLLENMFIQERKKLGRKFKVELIKLKGQTFYTDTEKFTNTIKTIFSQMSEETRYAYPNITVEVKGDSTKEFIEIKITQIASQSQSSPEVMLEEIKNGDFASIKENLTNLCDWSIESDFEDTSYRVNYLKSSNVKDIEKLEYKPSGFTHILRFYNK